MRFAIVVVVAVTVPWPTTLPAVQVKDKKIPPKIDNKLGGKTLEQWFPEISNKDRSKAENAIKAVLMWPPKEVYIANGLPVFLKELAKHKPPTILDLSMRVNLAIGLGFILAGAEEPNAQDVKEAVRLLTGLLKDGQAIVRIRAAEALGIIGPDAKTALTSLLDNAENYPTSWEVRLAATAAIGKILQDPDSKEGPPAIVMNKLFKILQSDPASRVRFAGVRAVAMVGGPADAVYRSAMIQTLDSVAAKDADPGVKIWAHMAIMGITDINEARLGVIAGFLSHKDFNARLHAVQVLGMLGGKAKSQVLALASALRDEEPDIIGVAIVALGNMGSAAALAVPALENVASKTDLPEPLRKAAEEAIKAIKAIKGKEKEKR